MKQPLLNKGFTGLGQLGILLGLLGVGLILGSLLAGVIWQLMTGQPMLKMADDMLKPEYSGAAKMVQGVNTFLVFFVPAVVFAFFCFRNGWIALGFGSPMHWKIAGIGLLLLLCSGPMIDALTTINKSIPIPAAARAFFEKMESAYEAQVKVIAEVKSFPQFLLSLFMIALLPAVFEEVLFRGGLQGILQRWLKKPWLAIVITSIVFSAIHASWFGFLPRIALGVVLGGIFYYTHNIWYSILVHFANNAAVVAYMYYLHLSGKPVSVSSEPSFPIWVGLVAAVALFLLFRWLRNSAKAEVPREIFYEPGNPFDNRNELA
jgi:hypothetical protein